MSQPEATHFRSAIRLLIEGEVQFVVIGGLAITAHGSAYVTTDLDICYNRTRDNIQRLSDALAPVHPTLRGAPKDLPFRLDSPTIQAGFNFTLDTDLGPLDLLAEVPPIGAYEDVLKQSEEVDLFGHAVNILSLRALIVVKRATGRMKDKLVLPELEALLEIKEGKAGLE